MARFEERCCWMAKNSESFFSAASFFLSSFLIFVFTFFPRRRLSLFFISHARSSKRRSREKTTALAHSLCGVFSSLSSCSRNAAAQPAEGKEREEREVCLDRGDGFSSQRLERCAALLPSMRPFLDSETWLSSCYASIPLLST